MKSISRFKPVATILLLLSLVFIWGCAGSHDSRSIEQKVRDRILATGKKEILQEAGKADKEYLIPVYVALEGKRYNQAITLSQKLQIDHPSDEDLYYIQGIVYYEQNDLATALRYFEKTIAINNNRGDAYYFQAMMLYFLNKNSRALSSINTAILNEKTAFQVMTLNKLTSGGEGTIEGSQANLFFMRAAVNRNLHKRDDALRDINRAISIDPSNSPTYYTFRGGLYFDRSELKQAYRDFLHATELNPNDGAAWGNMSTIDTYMGRYDAAIYNIQNALMHDHDEFHSNLAIAYWLKGNRDSALETMGKVIRKKPNAHTYYHLGYFHHLLGNQSQARRNFKQAEQLNARVLDARHRILTELIPKNAPTYNYFQSEFKTAQQYLGTGNGVVNNANQARTPTLKITSLNIDPDPVRVNRAFDIKISFKPDIPAAGNDQLPILFYFKIYKNQKKLFTSKKVTIERLNGKEKTWTHHMNPVPKAGVYKIVAFVKYKEIVDQKSISLTIE